MTVTPITQPIRSQTKQRLYDLIKATAPTDSGNQPVQVSYGWPGNQMEKNCIWIGHVSGPKFINSLRAGRKHVRDEFDIDIWVVCATPKKDDATAESLCEMLTNLVCDVLAGTADPTTGGPHLRVGGTPLLGLEGGATISDQDGPNAEPTDEGSVAIAKLVVSCKTRLD